MRFWPWQTGNPRVWLALAVLVATMTPLLAQAPVPPASGAPQPAFAGTWAPADPARADELFVVGLTVMPGTGRLTIEQGPSRLTMSMALPDEALDMILDLTGRFHSTIVYRVSEARRRPGGFGAGGPLPEAGPHWLGGQLVIPDARPAAVPVTLGLSIEGDRLRLETRARGNTVVEWFTRVR